jgi:hypothetical protein
VKVRKKKFCGVECFLLHNYLYAEDPDQVQVLENMYRNMNEKSFRKMLGLDEGECVFDETYRSILAVDVVDNIREQVKRLERSGIVIAYMQEF